MLCKRGLCRRRCPSVRPSVCRFVTRVYSVETAKHIINLFPPSGSHTIPVFPYQTSFRYSDAPPPTGASNASWVSRNRDSEPISGFIACCVRCDRLGVINTASPDRDKLWHLSLVVSGGVCWWLETTTKCLWQEVSTLRQRQQSHI